MTHIARLAILIAIAPFAFAELAPEVYRAMQQQAPELLYVEVTDVDIDRDFRKPSGCGFFEFEITRNVVLQAKVLRVMRSASNVKPGTMISVRYASLKQCEGWVGARPIPLLDEDQKVYAYLSRAERGFVPAARGASFASDLDR